jgi:uncharacterized protein YndB with AHSA1/START domain
MATYTVVRQLCVSASIDTCWGYLTNNALVSKWFADVSGEISPGASYEFHFGDGDFFRGATDLMEPPTHLGIWWRFMGVGATSRIDFHLLDHPGGTDIAVVDRGSYSRHSALELREGWDDFFSRLKRSIETGANTRYRWSEVIGTGAVLKIPPSEIESILSRTEWWNRGFPASRIQFEPESGGGLVFADDAWKGRVTRARVVVSASPDGSAVSVSHAGWADLPESLRYEERKRYAELWAAALASLESNLTLGG